jgi:hypothetical protein
MKSDYPEEILTLKNELKEIRKRCVDVARKQEYTCILRCFDDASYVIGYRTKFNDGRYYWTWDVHLTQDSAYMWRMTVEEAVNLSHRLPIKTQIMWVTGPLTSKEIL